jgi:hypothetical protein
MKYDTIVDSIIACAKRIRDASDSTVEFPTALAHASDIFRTASSAIAMSDSFNQFMGELDEEDDL